jgi:hypothetical protein
MLRCGKLAFAAITADSCRWEGAMKIIITTLACLLATSAFAASEYVTYKTGSNRYGAVAWQIDTTTIRQEGTYRTFWNQIWEYGLKQPTTYSDNEELGFLSQKFAVDCVHQRFGPHFIDSNWPAERRHRARIETMRWVPLGPVMARTVCAEK